MADLGFVDTHVHYWDLEHPKLAYSWLAPDAIHPILGDIGEIKFPLFDGEAYRREIDGANVTKVVHVQAAIGIADPVDETRWLQEQAGKTGFPHAIVAYSNLKDPDVERQLEEHMEASPLVRGIRDFSDGDYLVDPDFERGYSKLAKYGLVCDLDCFWENMHKARDLARRHPATPMILDHAGFPLERTDEYFESWKGGLRTLAQADNAWCKISGLGMGDNDWTADSLRPWVMHCIEAFGVDRCLFGTNWPVDKMYSTYPALIDAYTELIKDFSADEQVALFSGNAEKVFRI
jgi:predicted TIM-barrel fold metal-dependent hydrolase